ncbi:hypothetical protein KIPB_009382 [Kipferlia bialata]|uniref:Uncharacterized protein n=1 Tax=Kipferlia bialata TaxID=797122 RepID=A0A391NY15_9EUKA|nr:hypothetical protein KIPB_009382 [Kipferlia bialata]|eukprot:g9382.t1
MSRSLKYMWCLDIQGRDIGVSWHRQSIPGPAVMGFRNTEVKPVLTSTEDLLLSYAPMAFTLSLRGQVEAEGITYVGMLPETIRNPFTNVDVGPYTCLFRLVRPPGEQVGWVDHLFMYDRVSGEATLAQPLPYPDEVTSACMLNPTTMLVIQRDRALVVELDPELFERFTDAD